MSWGALSLFVDSLRSESCIDQALRIDLAFLVERQTVDVITLKLAGMSAHQRPQVKDKVLGC